MNTFIPLVWEKLKKSKITVFPLVANFQGIKQKFGYRKMLKIPMYMLLLSTEAPWVKTSTNYIKIEFIH
jgi:hypothetical protein